MSDDWLFQLPSFFDEIEAAEAQSVLDNVAGRFDGVLYHHRGVRVPGYDATFVYNDEEHVYELVVDGVGDRASWVQFDPDKTWNVFFAQPPEDAPYFAWMSDEEFETEEADDYTTIGEAVGFGRFSFGLYLQAPDIWEELEERSNETEAPFFIYRQSGKTLVPEHELEEYEEVVPPELFGEDPPDYLGILDADLGAE